jgi:hypothetical protein
LKQIPKMDHPPSAAPKRIFWILSLMGKLRQVRVRESLGLLPIAHRSEKPGNDEFFPHFQVQGGIKMT